MVVWRIIYPLLDDWKLMRILEVPEGQGVSIPKTCTKVLPEEWGNMLAQFGEVEADVIVMLGITEVQDMRE